MKRNRKILLVIILIIIVLIIIRVKLKSSSSDSENVIKYDETMSYGDANYNDVEVDKTAQEVLMEQKEIPNDSSSVLEEYTGNVDLEDVYEHMYNAFYILVPDLYEYLYDATDETIQEYYEAIPNLIRDQLGLVSLEEFSTFVKNVVWVAGDMMCQDSSVSGTLTDDGEYSSVDLTIEYSDTSIEFTLEIIDEITEGKPSVRYIVK